jgi:hypothetical protein
MTKPKFYKISHRTESFPPEEVSNSIQASLVYVHGSTKPKGKSLASQGDNFIAAEVGDYFYLTYGNSGIVLLGQFSGPANVFSTKGKGWLDRPYRIIRMAIPNKGYQGPKKWWAPSDNSTFIEVPQPELQEFEEHILKPFFSISLSD